MVKRKKIKKVRQSGRDNMSILALLPLAALLIFNMVDFFGSDHASIQEAAQAGGALPTALRASFYALGGFFLLKQFTRNINWITARLELMACLFFVLASITWSNYADRLVINWVHFVGGILVAFAAAKYFSKHNLDLAFRYLAVVCGISILFSFFSVLFVPARGLEYFEWEEVYRWRGMTSNANALGMVGLLTIWANFAALWFNRSKSWRLIHLVFIVIAAICLWGAESRTSQFLSVVSILMTVLLSYVFSSTNAAVRRRLIVLGYLGVVAAVAIAVLYGDMFQADKMAGSIGRDSNLSGRTYIWQDAFKLIGMRPWVGWSFDGHLTAYEVINQNLGHYHNGFIDLTVNGGILGLLIFLLLLFRMFRNTYKLLRLDYKNHVPVAVLYMVFLVYNITEVTFGAFGNAFWIIMMFTYLLSELLLSRLRRKSRRKKFVEIPKQFEKNPQRL